MRKPENINFQLCSIKHENFLIKNYRWLVHCWFSTFHWISFIHWMITDVKWTKSKIPRWKFKELQKFIRRNYFWIKCKTEFFLYIAAIAKLCWNINCSAVHSETDSNYFTMLTLEIVAPLTKAELISENKLWKFLCISVFDFFYSYNSLTKMLILEFFIEWDFCSKCVWDCASRQGLKVINFYQFSYNQLILVFCVHGGW